MNASIGPHLGNEDKLIKLKSLLDFGIGETNHSSVSNVRRKASGVVETTGNAAESQAFHFCNEFHT